MFPAAATTTTPAEFATSTACSIAVEGDGPPRDRFMTFAPFDTAQRIPLATASVEQDPEAEQTLTGSIFAPGAAPRP